MGRSGRLVEGEIEAPFRWRQMAIACLDVVIALMIVYVYTLLFPE